MYKDVFLLLGSGKDRKKYKFNIIYTSMQKLGTDWFCCTIRRRSPMGTKIRTIPTLLRSKHLKKKLL